MQSLALKGYNRSMIGFQSTGSHFQRTGFLSSITHHSNQIPENNLHCLYRSVYILTHKINDTCSRSRSSSHTAATDRTQSAHSAFYERRCQMTECNTFSNFLFTFAMMVTNNIYRENSRYSMI